MEVDKLRELIQDTGVRFKENERAFYTVCPACNGKFGKCAISKESNSVGSTVCFSGKCDFDKQGFVSWYALTMGVTIAVALKAVGGKEKVYKHFDEFAPDIKPSDEEKIPSTELPRGAFSLDFEGGERGAAYIMSRGISTEVAKQYGITYDSLEDRIVFPIGDLDGKLVGWQARSVRKVEDSMKVRNNVGFRRDRCVMFLDRLKGSGHAIICEGPIDAIKFHLAGGNVATMGKAVTPKQLQLILRPSVTKVYLALDDDAFAEMRKLCSKIYLPVYRPEIPQSCRDRCKAAGKKADFGECTMDEALEAVRNAPRIDADYLFEDEVSA